MTTKTLSDADIVRIAQAYYDAVDSGDPDRIADAYHPAPNTTLKFNTDAPIVGKPAIREFSARFSGTKDGMKGAVSGIKHTMIDVWITPLMGNVVPIDLEPVRSDATVTVVSTALPTFTIGEGPGAKRLSVPATSIFTIDIATEKLVSTHNMFDIGQVYAAVGGGR